MKKLLNLIITLLVINICAAQVPQHFNYQAVIRDNSGELLVNQNVSIKISILDESEMVLYSETHAVTSNAYGMVNLKVGSGVPVTNTFESIEWVGSSNSIKIEADINGGTAYVDIGTSELVSVPYALHSLSALSLGDKGVYSPETDTLFVVKDHSGNVVFAVFPDGAEIIVDESAKGKIGGFAVSGRNPNKAENLDIFKVTPDSTRVFVNETAKGKVGGFAVSGRNPNKSISDNYLVITSDSTRIFVKDSIAGFGIANIEGGIAENFLNLNKQNYLIGHQAGSNTTGAYNSMLGYQTGYTNSSGSNNIFFGYKAGYLNQSGGNNVFIGTESGYVNQFTFQNTYVGYRSGYDLSGSGNTVMGSMAGENAGGGNNTFIGTSAGRIASGGNNTFVGNGAGYSFPNENTGTRNTYIGQAVGSFTNTGSYNVMLGFNAGYLNYEGSRNTFLGYDAGHNIHEGSGNIFIGHNAGYYADGISNRLIIDNANIDSTDVLFYGEFDQNHLRINGNVGINYQAYNSYGLIVDIPDGQSSIYTLLIYGDAWASGGSWNSSDVRYKKNITTYENALNTIMQFRGVSYDWRVDEFPQQRFSDGRQLGFIAQEVEEIVPDLVKEGPEGYKGVEYNKFTPIIVEAIKEQQQIIDKQKNEIDQLKDRLNKLEKLVDQMK